jgi:hypothetical protein
VLALCDACCDDLLDGEHRTACRRLLARVATGEPAIFRRRARSETGAAAICWLVGNANDSFDPGYSRLMVKDLVAHFGLSGTPSQRALTMLRAIGIEHGYVGDHSLGSPEYLVAAQRQRIIEQRERHLEGENGR